MNVMQPVMFTVKDIVIGTRSIPDREMLSMSKSMAIGGHWVKNSIYSHIE